MYRLHTHTHTHTHTHHRLVTAADGVAEAPGLLHIHIASNKPIRQVTAARTALPRLAAAGLPEYELVKAWEELQAHGVTEDCHLIRPDCLLSLTLLACLLSRTRLE